MLAYSPGLNGQPPQTSAHLPADVAAGRTTKVEVSASGSEGLWNIAADIHRDLSDDMKKTNSVESIFNSLVDDAVKHHGFKRGSDDGRLPGQFQGNQKSGRDLDLIYANDKFQVDLKGPSQPPAGAGMKPQANTKYSAWNDDQKQKWNTFLAQHPDAAKTFDGLNSGEAQKAVMDVFEKASAKGADETKAYGDLVGSKGFTALHEEDKVRVLQLADRRGAKQVSDFIHDDGFKFLQDKNKKVPSADDDDKRSAVTLVLEKARDDDTYWNAAQHALKGDGGFRKFDNAEHRGTSLVYMAAYTGRHKGYQEWGGGNKMPDGDRANALKNLWNNLIGRKEFYVEKTAYTEASTPKDQLNIIDYWVDQSGYRKSDYDYYTDPSLDPANSIVPGL
jgi:hypothetical protein